MLELHITDNDVSNGSIAVGWCVDKETLNELNEKGIKNPVLVLMTAPKTGYDPDSEENFDSSYGKKREYRKVVPLKDLVAYVEFKSSGQNIIWGFIATDQVSDYSLRKVKSYYYDREANGYFNDIWDYWDCEPGRRYKDSTFTAQALEVDVPQEVFAKEPPEWEKNWVNKLYRHEPVDQCEYRRRRLFAYTLQPIWFGIIGIVFILFQIVLPLLLGLLIGARNLSLKIFTDPEGHGGMHVFKEGSIFINEEAEGWRRYLRLPFMPLVLIALAGLGYILFKAHVFASVASVVLSILTFIAVVYGVVYLLSNIVEWVVQHYLNKDDPAWFFQEGEMDLITCSGRKKPYKVSELPSHHRSISLRFQEVKSKICRPFSR